MKRFHIVTDPSGIAWETFHTFGSIPVYGADTAVFNHGDSVIPTEGATRRSACCVPWAKAVAIAAGATCCGP